MALRIDKINLKATDVAALPVYGLITTGTNLNTLDGSVYGKYWQSENANSPTSLNYPVASAGTLLVLKNNASSLATSCTQIYLPYNSNEIYSRSFYSSWTAWSRFAIIDMNGANSTIKSLTGLTTALSIGQGGTGAKTAADARNNLGFDDLGIGISAQAALASLNWQQYDFVNGSYFLINSNNWTNAPTGFPTTASGGEVWHVEVTGIAGTSIQLQVTVNTITDNAFKTYSIRITGNKGSRSAKTRRLLVDTDEGITTPGNLIARTTLGSLPAAETLGAIINSSLYVGTTENIATSLQAISPANSALGLGRLAVFKKGATSAQDATAYYNFYSDGNFKMTGTITTGGLVANSGIVSNTYISAPNGNITGGGLVSTGGLSIAGTGNFGGSILANAGANVGVSPHNINSNNGVRLWASSSDISEGQYVNTVGGGWYGGNWSLGAVRGGSTDLRACQLNVSSGTGGAASYMFKPNGVADGLQWNNISDRRQKDNIKTIENPIEKMKQFHGVTFDYKNGVPSAGYIAQDVLEVLPEVVSEDHEGTLSMNVAGVGALHHEAILVLISQVEQLTLQVEELKTALANK